MILDLRKGVVMNKYANVVLLFAVFALLGMGCSEQKNPLPSKAHPESWTQSSSEEFHGTKVIESGTASCTSCHGADLQGGEVQSSCFSCHSTYPHPENWKRIAAVDFHGQYIRQDGWSMESCAGCHGANFLGGRSGSSCAACHKGRGGPRACSTCHGSQKNAAPPEDLSGRVSSSSLGVGAHQLHVDAFSSCDICHSAPATFDAPGHIDGSANAEVNPGLGWDRNRATCTTGCHQDAGKSYVWNGD